MKLKQNSFENVSFQFHVNVQSFNFYFGVDDVNIAVDCSQHGDQILGANAQSKTD